MSILSTAKEGYSLWRASQSERRTQAWEDLSDDIQSALTTVAAHALAHGAEMQLEASEHESRSAGMSRIEALLTQSEPLEAHELSDLCAWRNTLREDCDLFGETAEDAARFAKIDARIVAEEKKDLNMEPVFISQNGDPMTTDERHAWFQARADEAKAMGCVHGRASIHPTIPNLALYEGWRVRPESDGEQRWQLTAA